LSLVTDAFPDYYAHPGPTTELSDFADRVAELPSDPERLAQIVRGLVLHEGVAAHCGLKFSAERLADRERVGAAAILQRVLDFDDSSLATERPAENRMVGYCYHFAVLHCAFLRAKGVPSRARCGFAAYYREGAWIDHWVVEYWNGGGWIVIDPDSGRNVVTPAEFHDAGRAWRLCRDGSEDASVHGNHVLWGWDELRGSLISDLAALNKVEVGDWETWCDWIDIENKDQPDAELDAYLDPVAVLVSGEGAFQELRQAFDRDERVRPPPRLFECAD